MTMLQLESAMNFRSISDNLIMQNQPTSAAECTSEDMSAEADEPPDFKLQQKFQKHIPAATKSKPSLLSQMIHTSDSDSHVDEDDYAFYESGRVRSNASTYSRSSAVSIPELTSSTGHTSPHTNSPSPTTSAIGMAGLPLVFKQNLFQIRTTISVPDDEPVAPSQKKTLSDGTCEQKLQLGLGRKRCITFACNSKADVKAEAPKLPATDVKKPTEQPRKCSLRFLCPSKTETINTPKPRIRLASPPPPIKRTPITPTTRMHRGSDATLRTASPKLIKKLSPATYRPRRGSMDSDASSTEATRFHEFAGSDQEVDDWTKESGCFERRLTIDDTLTKENDLRKLAREAEEEDDLDDNEDDAEDDEDDMEDDEEDEEPGRVIHSPYESDEGFRTDDEQGFALSDNESDGDSDYDWWAPAKSAVGENPEHIRPSVRPRRGSESSIESDDNGIPISPQLQRKRSRLLKPHSKLAPELPDSTDFVCGTLDEDKPLEQAYRNHIAQRRLAKRQVLPQDIDPTFPTSDLEIDEEEDEVSDHAQTESDHPLFFTGMDMQEERHGRPRPTSKRSPLPSPRRLKSPPPISRRTTSHRSPPPAGRRARSPAPVFPHHARLSSSVPRRGSQPHMRERHFEEDPIEEEQDNTPRFSRRAIDIVMGLEKKRERRREKLHEKHCRKVAKSREKKLLPKGKGAQRMRDLGVGLNEYRGRKCIAMPPPEQDGEAVHMMSY